ncbi:MAG: hypothetical protein AAF292_09895 [Pseudomonadota bacterium]
MTFLSRKLKTPLMLAISAAMAVSFAACSDSDGGPASAAPPPVASPPPPAPPPPAPPPPASPPPPPAGSVTISGSVTFEDVGVDTSNNDFVLDLSDLTALPARGVVVEAVNAAGAVLASTVTSDTGQYALNVAANTDVRIEVEARLLQTTGATWDVPVLDNTAGNALYVLQGSLTNSGSTNSTRDLFAPSGSNGFSAYTGPRTSGPFAILDEILNGLRLIETESPNLDFPNLQIFWSVNNRPGGDDIPAGEIPSTAFVNTINGIPTILVSGDIDTDTDEFDEHVITHEFGHYFQELLSRDDSIGGSHSLDSLLDARVAFSEGWGNAISAIITEDPIYVDAGFGSNLGFAFNLDLNGIGSALNANGWYGESSIQSILYDVFDSTNDGPDSVSVGFGPLFDAFTSPTFTDSDASTTIFSFIEALVEQPGVSTSDLAPLLALQDINGTGEFATGETNDGGITQSLPIFVPYTVGDPPINICSIDDAGEVNRLGNRVLIIMNNPSSGVFTITMTRTSGPFDRDPDFTIRNEGTFVTGGFSEDPDTETVVAQLPAGQLIVDARDFENTDPDNESPAPSGDACFDFSAL